MYEKIEEVITVTFLK